MARVTVEDCILRIPNRFALVMTAAQRSREISVGAEPTVERDRDKNPVVALREIAEETVDIDEIEASLVRGLQKQVENEEQVEDGEDIRAAERALSEYAAMSFAAPLPAAGSRDGGRPAMIGFEDVSEAEAAGEGGRPPRD